MGASRRLGCAAAAALLLASPLAAAGPLEGHAGGRAARVAELAGSAERARLAPDEAARRLRAREAKRLEQQVRRASVEPTAAPKAVGCDSPCEAGLLVRDGLFHDLLLDCHTGAFGIRTGALHPATIAGGGKQDLLFDAAFGNAAGGRTAVFVHEDGLMLDEPGGRQACLFEPPDTVDEPGPIGLEQEWMLAPRAGLELLVRHELVAFGSGPNDAGVRMSLLVENVSAAESATVGLRWWLDPSIALDDGPSLTTIRCDPFTPFSTWTEEHELTAEEVEEFLLLTNDDLFGSEPVIEYVIGTSSVPGFPDTATPDRLVNARWANAPDEPPPPWDYVAFEGDPTGDDSVLLLYHGFTAPEATLLGPGESISLSTLLLSRCDRIAGGCLPPTLSTTVEGAPACPGEPVTLSGRLESPGLGDYGYTWTFGDGSRPVVVTDPTVPVEHVYESPDFYRPRLTASDGTEPGCSSFSEVDVDVLVGPAPTGVLSDELRVARTASDVRLSWPGSPVAPPSFVAFSSDELAAIEQEAGWLDARRLGWTLLAELDDPGAIGSGELRFYKVFPADPDCGFPVIPPGLVGYREILRDEMEVESGWIVDPDGTDDATTGIWVREDPNGTAYQVEDDHTPDPGVACWVTGNLPGAGDGDDDVDGGCTTLQSPVWDVSGRSRVRLGYWRAWEIAAAMDDVFLVEISNDGGMSWRELETVDSPTSGFQQAVFDLESVFGEPASLVVLRFHACDRGAGSFVEAAVDDVLIEETL